MLAEGYMGVIVSLQDPWNVCNPTIIYIIELYSANHILFLLLHCCYYYNYYYYYYYYYYYMNITCQLLNNFEDPSMTWACLLYYGKKVSIEKEVAIHFHSKALK